MALLCNILLYNVFCNLFHFLEKKNHIVDCRHRKNLHKNEFIKHNTLGITGLKYSIIVAIRCIKRLKKCYTITLNDRLLIMANTRPLCVMCHLQVYFYTSVLSYNFKAKEGDFLQLRRDVCTHRTNNYSSLSPEKSNFDLIKLLNYFSQDIHSMVKDHID